MKKNLFYLFALVCSMSLFTACSDDDDNDEPGWKKLPQGQIEGSNVEFQLNGGTTTGTVTFQATSSEAAKVGLQNVIDGYADVTVDVAMTEQADGSFNLAGTKEINAKPVVSTRAAAYLTVTVAGSISTSGKLTLDVTTTGLGLYIGTYGGSTLNLIYGGSAMIGKTVVFDATDGDNATILLTDVIPGEPTVTLTGISMKKDGFSGTATTSGGAQIAYKGSRANKVLTLNLDVTLSDPKEWAGTYPLTSYALEEIDEAQVIEGGLYFDWPAGAMWDGLDMQIKAIGSMLLPQILKTVTLAKDGNITAEYNGGTVNISQDVIMNCLKNIYPTTEEFNKTIPTAGWIQSPKNLAYWFEKDGKLYVKLDISAIIAQAMNGDSNVDLSEIISIVLNGDPSTIKTLLNTILHLDEPEVLQKTKVSFSNISDKTITTLVDWVKNGIPMNVKMEEGKAALYLDATTLDPLLVQNGSMPNSSVPVSDLEILWSILVGLDVIPQEASAANFLIGLVCQTYSYGFSIGLDLQAK